MTEKFTQSSEGKYFLYLVELGEKYLNGRQYKDVSYDILCCYNNMRCGWTDDIDRFSMSPNH